MFEVCEWTSVPIEAEPAGEVAAQPDWAISVAVQYVQRAMPAEGARGPTEQARSYMDGLSGYPQRCGTRLDSDFGESILDCNGDAIIVV